MLEVTEIVPLFVIVPNSRPRPPLSTATVPVFVTLANPACAPAGTVNFDQIARHYYTSHLRLNPSGIVPVGPAMDWTAPHRRG